MEIDLFKADIFSLGVTFIEVMTGERHQKLNRNEEAIN